MKLNNLRQLIKEELKHALNENQFEKGDIVIYMGERHKVLSDNGYVVELTTMREEGKKQNTVMLNYAQVRERVRRPEDYMNENDSSEFNYEKAIQAQLNRPSSLGDLELGATYEVEYGARDLYGDKDTGTTKISITQKDLDRYDKNMSIQNYLTDLFNTNAETGKSVDTGYRINNIKSIKKL